jgi:hypothetical protein
MAENYLKYLKKRVQFFRQVDDVYLSKGKFSFYKNGKSPVTLRYITRMPSLC